MTLSNRLRAKDLDLQTSQDVSGPQPCPMHWQGQPEVHAPHQPAEAGNLKPTPPLAVTETRDSGGAVLSSYRHLPTPAPGNEEDFFKTRPLAPQF